MADFVPAELTGAWRREVITTPGGLRDATTRVMWLQTHSWYADIRVPAARPSRPGAAGFGDFTPEELVDLATVQGFGGQLAVTPRLCAWRRDLDFQPPSPTPDEGTWKIDGPVMIERGVHADYEEVWVREPDTQAMLMAFSLEHDSLAPGRKGLMVVAGDHFLAILDRPHPLPAGEDLPAIVRADLAGGGPMAAARRLAMPLCYGRLSGGAAPWEVKLSSWPWLEGLGFWGPHRPVFDHEAGVLDWNAADGRQSWRLLDSSVPPDEAAGRLTLPGAAG
jgi:hypothetical protein